MSVSSMEVYGSRLRMMRAPLPKYIPGCQFAPKGSLSQEEGRMSFERD